MCIKFRFQSYLKRFLVINYELTAFQGRVAKNILRLRNGPDKNDSNNGNEHVGMQKGANFSIVCTYFWLA